MSEGLNRVMLLGNLGADPELRFTQGGQAVLNLRLATTENYLDKNKQRQERTDWHDCVVWGARAEGLSKCLNKGSRILVEGSLRTSSYEKDGVKRHKTEVNVTNVVFADGKREGGHDAPREERSRYENGRGGSAKHTAPPEDFGAGGFSGEDLPFVYIETRWDRV